MSVSPLLQSMSPQYSAGADAVGVLIVGQSIGQLIASSPPLQYMSPQYAAGTGAVATLEGDDIVGMAGMVMGVFVEKSGMRNGIVIELARMEYPITPASARTVRRSAAR